jgi:transcriptional regulator with XRE-family HTH domain
VSSQHKEEEGQLRVRLRALRGERSQEEFARLVGLTRSALANYENGRTHPKPSILRQISQRAGLSDNFLLSGQVRNEYELNLVVTGQGFLNECHETGDELTIVRALRAVDPSTVQTVVGALIRDIGENPDTRATLGEGLGADLQRLDAIHRAGGQFSKGSTKEEQAAAVAELKRMTPRSNA